MSSVLIAFPEYPIPYQILPEIRELSKGVESLIRQSIIVFSIVSASLGGSIGAYAADGKGALVIIGVILVLLCHITR